MAEAAAESLCQLGCSRVQLHHHGLASSKWFRRLGERERFFTSDPGLRLLCWAKDQPPAEWSGAKDRCKARRAGKARPFAAFRGSRRQSQPLATPSGLLQSSALLGSQPLATHAQSSALPGSQPLATHAQSSALPIPVAAAPPALAAEFVRQKARLQARLQQQTATVPMQPAPSQPVRVEAMPPAPTPPVPSQSLPGLPTASRPVPSVASQPKPAPRGQPSKASLAQSSRGCNRAPSRSRSKKRSRFNPPPARQMLPAAVVPPPIPQTIRCVFPEMAHRARVACVVLHPLEEHDLQAWLARLHREDVRTSKRLQEESLQGRGELSSLWLALPQDTRPQAPAGRHIAPELRGGFQRDLTTRESKIEYVFKDLFQKHHGELVAVSSAWRSVPSPIPA